MRSLFVWVIHLNLTAKMKKHSHRGDKLPEGRVNDKLQSGRAASAEAPVIHEVAAPHWSLIVAPLGAMSA